MSIFEERIQLIYPALKKELNYIQAIIPELKTDRKNQLNIAADRIYELYRSSPNLILNFICTHNSRRSQLSESWSFLAGWLFRLEKLRSVSGGTQATAFNVRAVRTLEQQGFSIEMDSTDPNPVYCINIGDGLPSHSQYSKVFNQAVKPGESFVALMTCDHADQNCPIIPEAIARISLNFIDPGKSDGTVEESTVYLERSREIAANIIYLFSRVSELLALK